MTTIVKQTTDLSIAAQVLTGIFTLDGFNMQLVGRHTILKDILLLETVVQIVELYLYVALLRKINTRAMTITRYYDWFFTTPTMLLSAIVFFEYEASDQPFTFVQFVDKHRQNIAKVFIYNAFMLICGYLGELGAIDKSSATVAGFVGLLSSFNIVYNHYGVRSETGKTLSKFLFVIWSLYGIAYLFPDTEKNISYNILDVVAKNLWGVYIYYRIKLLQPKK